MGQVMLACTDDLNSSQDLDLIMSWLSRYYGVLVTMTNNAMMTIFTLKLVYLYYKYYA